MDDVWEVKEIVDKRRRRGEVEFRVRWADDTHTWEPTKNLLSCELVIEEYENKKRKICTKCTKRRKLNSSEDEEMVKCKVCLSTYHRDCMEGETCLFCEEGIVCWVCSKKISDFVFRCSECHLASHNKCTDSKAQKEGVCVTCNKHPRPVQRILTHKDNPREYLIKFEGISYRALSWVSGVWLEARHTRKVQAYVRADVAPVAEKDIVNPKWLLIAKILDEKNDEMLVQWVKLSIEDATWEPRGSIRKLHNYSAALKRYKEKLEIDSASNRLQRPGTKHDTRPDPHKFEILTLQPSWINGQLKPFQIDGLNWLIGNWMARTTCILADEMGLGKTIQSIVFLSYLLRMESRFPFLVLAPNSTLDNWAREFVRWAPEMHVAVVTGTREERNLILKHEVFNSVKQASLKCHVVLLSYEICLLHNEFKRVNWDCLIVDEGHRLKNDKSKLYTSLRGFKIAHKILVTGTPLQNNIRELFNLMHFLNPRDFADPEELANEYELSPNSPETCDKIKELHESLRPHFLRRLKAEVIKDLPSKCEIIVPIKMTTLQKELLKDVYSTNYELLRALGRSARKYSSGSGKLQNILMQCRKVLSHPFLLPHVEDGLGKVNEQDALARMIESGGKMQLLAKILPKLFAQDHKVAIFCQFKHTLDILEDFLDGCKYTFARIDGDTERAVRQELIDDFNSGPVQVFLLSTRAGGVGINLTGADTVIIHDVDWNPHMDLQAIARCHRIGQTKPVLALKFMIAGSVEEKIVGAGRKKLALEHVIVQKMKAVDDVDLIDVLKFGASAIFEDESDTQAAQYRYDDDDVDKLLERHSIQEDVSSGLKFGFEKVWLTNNPDTTPEVDTWEAILTKLKQGNTKASVSGPRKRNVINYAERFEDAADEGSEFECPDTDSTATSFESMSLPTARMSHPNLNLLDHINGIPFGTTFTCHPTDMIKRSMRFSSLTPCWVCEDWDECQPGYHVPTDCPALACTKHLEYLSQVYMDCAHKTLFLNTITSYKDQSNDGNGCFICFGDHSCKECSFVCDKNALLRAIKRLNLNYAPHQQAFNILSGLIAQLDIKF